jgi:hypothetical protein
MSDEYQIEIPPSFYEVYLDARRRLTASRDRIRTQYEICEDLAQHLVEYCNATLHGLGITEADVLVRVHAGLVASSEVVDAREATDRSRRSAFLVAQPSWRSRRDHGPAWRRQSTSTLASISWFWPPRCAILSAPSRLPSRAHRSSDQPRSRP